MGSCRISTRTSWCTACWHGKEWQCWLFLRTISNFGNDDGAGVGDMPGERFFDKKVFLSLVTRWLWEKG